MHRKVFQGTVSINFQVSFPDGITRTTDADAGDFLCLQFNPDANKAGATDLNALFADEFDCAIGSGNDDLGRTR
jgi:hypothetical protein